jgi:hypothetical protein
VTEQLFNPRFSRFGTAPESPPDDRDFSIRGFLSGPASLAALDLPDEVGTLNAEVHREFLPITDQGQEGSCTGHAMRNVKGVNERRARPRWRRRAVPDFSPRGLYVNGKREGGYPDEEGAYMRDVASAANKLGAPREKDWPYIPSFDARGRAQDIGEPVSRWLQWARPWTIGAYARVRTLEEMLVTLHQVGPLFIAMDLTESFMHPAANGYIQANPTGTALGGHATALLAAKRSERRFLCANSWGTGWGVGGYYWLDFDHFLTKARSEAWAIPDMAR